MIGVQSLGKLAEGLERFGEMQWDEIGRGLTAMGVALLEVGAVIGTLGVLAGFAGIIGAASLLIAIQDVYKRQEKEKEKPSLIKEVIDEPEKFKLEAFIEGNEIIVKIKKREIES